MNEPQHSQGSFVRSDSRSHHNATTKNVLIYFITGNPGYIGYYHTFLDRLFDLISAPGSATTQKIQWAIVGKSLQGFEPTPENISHGPFDFPDVIEATYEDVISQKIIYDDRRDQPYDGIILIGHSVGSYIALEVLSRIRRSSPSLSSPKMDAILLFPTVTHIAKSPSGVKFSTLFSIPHFPQLVHYISQYGFWALPDSALLWAVKKITGMPDDAAAVTAKFLRSKTGVAQSLHMARDEMATITDDKWEDEVWGVESEEKTGEAPRLVFYFGKDDHWVADHTRDALIKARGNTGKRAKMVVDEDKIPHGFCIHHSEQVAKKVRGWVEEMVQPMLNSD